MNWVATSRSSTTINSQTPKATLFSRNNSSTRSGSLTMMRAMAASVDSETLRATTCVAWALSNFTTSSMAPTLFGRNTENCRTSGPPILEVVSGNSTCMFFEFREKFRAQEYLTVLLPFPTEFVPVNVCLVGRQALRQNARATPFDLFIGLILLRIARGHGTIRK